MILLALACSATLAPPAGSALPAVVRWDPDTALVDSGLRGPPPAEGEEAIGAAAVANDWLFTLDQVVEVGLEMDPADIAALNADPVTPRPAAITLGGHRYADVGVRIKGRLGSRSSFDGKPALKVDFNEFVPGQTMRGVTILNLNNMVQDGSKIHELVAYTVYAAVGVPAPRVGYAHLTVNGVDYGLYSNVEAYNLAMLRRHYADPSGNLYDGDYYMPVWGSYTLLDFWPGLDDYFELDVGADVGLADIKAVTAAVVAAYGTDQFEETLDPLLDWDQFRHYWAAEAWAGHYDGYSFNRNNYRVYFDPVDGKARFSPWDPDWAFYEGTPVGSPYGLIAAGCQADPDCHAAATAALADVCATVAGLPLDAQITAAQALINPYLATDPRVGLSMTDLLAAQEATRAWTRDRCARMGGI